MKTLCRTKTYKHILVEKKAWCFPTIFIMKCIVCEANFNSIKPLRKVCDNEKCMDEFINHRKKRAVFNANEYTKRKRKLKREQKEKK